LFEGGIRVPAAISWPAKLKSGEERNQVAVNADWMPTLAELCGIDLKTNDLDGKSLVPIIMQKEHKTLHNQFCWQNGKHWAARKDNWKLLGNPAIRGEEFLPKDSLFLVDLNNDPGEMNNLASEYPTKVKELKSQYEAWLIKNRIN
jgi:arylsulfatase A-like enzyme